MDVYAKNTVEFVTVAVEYCLYLEHIREKNAEDLCTVMQKMLPLLYLKASLVEKPVAIELADAPVYVTEIEYEQMRLAVSELLGGQDDYLNGDEACSLSEDLTDIYQDLKDMAMNYKSGDRELTEAALGNCLDNFEDYWGRKLLLALRHLHELRYSDKADQDELSGQDYEGRD
ncbi:MAG: DUF5063 domain-containing protein [Paludibacteraceae bacterium]|nr:DUF5063 domain-containing protein [Paludibacteraceae bacterium]